MAGFNRFEIWRCFLDIFVKSGEDRMDSAHDVRRAAFLELCVMRSFLSQEYF